MKDVADLDIEFAKLSEYPRDEEMWWRLYKHFAPLLMLRARRTGVTETEASDLVQQTFVIFLEKSQVWTRVIRRLSNKKAAKVVYAYLSRILAYQSMNWSRRACKTYEVSGIPEEQLPWVNQGTDTDTPSDRDFFILRLLNKKLKEPEKIVIEKRINEEKTFDQISKELKISAVASRQRYSRAIRRARAIIIHEAQKMLASGVGDHEFLKSLINELS